MPAVSEKQAVAARIAKHAPRKLFRRNRGLLKMKSSDLSHMTKRNAITRRRHA